MVLTWRNSDSVRLNMVDSHVITPSEHLAWFSRVQVDSTCRWLLYSHDERPAGVGYVTDIAAESRTAHWGFYKSPDSPPGTGSRLCAETLDYAFGELPLDEIVGDVLATNAASIRIHRKFGFAMVKAESGDNGAMSSNRILRFELTRHAWIQRALMPAPAAEKQSPTN